MGPLVSCLCPTYGRCPRQQWLLEEAIESFLRQDYPHKELVILNDCRVQTLNWDGDPDLIRIVNSPARFPSLGEKRNQLVQLARGELLCPWDDDDISLPWRLSASVELMQRHGAEYVNPQVYWFAYRGVLGSPLSTGVGHNLSMMSRAAFDRVGGYPALCNGEDADLDRRLFSGVPSVGHKDLVAFAEKHWWYVYRWLVSEFHISGFGDRADEEYRRRDEKPLPTGSFLLQPRWRTDYVQLTRELSGLPDILDRGSQSCRTV